MKESHGVRTVIGKTHSEFEHGNCQYLHPISQSDEGAFAYVISPVYNDYRVGAQVMTNFVVVDPIVIPESYKPR